MDKIPYIWSLTKYLFMKNLKHFAIMASTIGTAVLCGCGSTPSSKTLVLYYSQTGATEAVAKEIQKLTGADIELIEVENPYDGTYDETIARCQEEMASGVVPSVKPLKSNLKEYDTIFLGYPIWFGSYARPIMGLLKSVDLSGKKIVPFCSFGSGGLEAGAESLKAQLPGSEILPGYGVRNARVSAIPSEVKRFLIENGYVEGEVIPLPEYSQQVPVTEEDTALFDAACGGYQFPLGTPLTVGSRVTPDGTDYMFKVQSGDARSTIYVTVPTGAKPEFTRVVR